MWWDLRRRRRRELGERVAGEMRIDRLQKETAKLGG